MRISGYKQPGRAVVVLLAVTDPLTLPGHVKTHWLTSEFCTHRTITIDRITIGGEFPVSFHDRSALCGATDCPVGGVTVDVYVRYVAGVVLFHVEAFRAEFIIFDALTDRGAPRLRHHAHGHGGGHFPHSGVD